MLKHVFDRADRRGGRGLEQVSVRPQEREERDLSIFRVPLDQTLHSDRPDLPDLVIRQVAENHGDPLAVEHLFTLYAGDGTAHRKTEWQQPLLQRRDR